MNLSVGAYRTEEGKPWILPSVAEAEKMVGRPNSSVASRLWSKTEARSHRFWISQEEFQDSLVDSSPLVPGFFIFLYFFVWLQNIHFYHGYTMGIARTCKTNWAAEAEVVNDTTQDKAMHPVSLGDFGGFQDSDPWDSRVLRGQHLVGVPAN